MNNLPLIHHIAIFSKSMIVSIGMNDLKNIKGTLPSLENKYHIRDYSTTH